MALANLIAYVVVFGLPILLVAEEIVHRFGAMRKAPALVPARLERRAATSARVAA